MRLTSQRRNDEHGEVPAPPRAGTSPERREVLPPAPAPSPWKPTKEQLAAAVDKVVPDVIAPDLDVLFVGINPGLYTAAIGHHFGRPGNRFWKVLHLAGFTPRQLSPFEEQELLAHRLGVTNMVMRTTATAAELSKTEIEEGGRLLEQKVATYRPLFVAVLGVQAYRNAFSTPKATVGEQPTGIAMARTWVLPNPSGLQAHYQLDDMVRLFAELRSAID